jgi:fumarylpyruvate hydrolase
MNYVFPPPPVESLEIFGTLCRFAVRRIYCVGRNYAAHVREMNKGVDSREPPFFFQKPADAIVHNGQVLPYPSLTKSLHHEVELVVALQSGGSRIDVSEALSHVFGYAVGVDLTRRDLQVVAKDKSWPWESAKAFDHSAPIGTIAAVKDFGHVENCAITLLVNQKPRQTSNTSDMTWGVSEIVSKLSEQFELKTGDIIMTGTPEGVGTIERGDVVTANIEGLPALSFEIAN